MRRIELQEIHDHPRFPVFLRDLVTDALQSLWEFGNSYRPILSRLLAGMDRAGTREVLDLCSGGGGPWLRLAREPELLRDSRVEVRLTDKYPNRSGLAWASAASTLVEFESEPVDAMRIPATLRGFRTMFSSFHHFGPDKARMMLAGAVEDGQGIGVFEVAGRSLKTMLMVCFLPVLSCFLAPSIRPFRWSRLVWTYLIPVVPFVLFYDGLVSCLRSYSREELEELVESLGSVGYTWEIGEERDGFLAVTYLVGYPDGREASGFNVEDAMKLVVPRR
jgi:hypothetical protein